MKSITTLIAILFAFLFLGPTASAAGWSSPGTTGDTIKRIYNHANFLQVQLTTHNQNPDSCPSATYFGLPKPPDIDTDQYDQFFSMLLAAELSGAKVRFWLSGCSGQNDQYPKITSIMIDR